MLPEYGTKEFDEYLEKIAQGKIKHKYYDLSVEHAKDMSVHTEGTKPEKILNRARPHEDPEIKKYRLESWEPITKGTAEKVISVVNRIFNPRLYNITYKESPSKIGEKETLEYYLHQGMPLYKSLMKFITEVFIKKDFTDPNSVIFVEPVKYEVEEIEYFKPIPKVYFARTVIDFEDWEYFTIQDKDELIIIDTEWIRKFKKEKKDQKDRYTLTFEYRHGFGVPPVFRSGGVVLKTEYPLMFQSFISGVLPHWNTAVSWRSDLNGSIVNTLYPEKWEFTVDCDNEKCHGGKVTIDKDKLGFLPEGAQNSMQVDCNKCHGTGRISTKSPFHVYQINRDAINPDAPLPTPPFGYAGKETQSIELLDEFIEKEIEKGLYSINMDIVSKVGEVQSGVAKTIDRQDLDSFLQQISSHVFGRVIPKIIVFTIMWRYKNVLTDKELEDMMPEIEEPSAFDVLSVNDLLSELEGVNNAGLNSSIIIGIQKDIIEKRFTSESQKKRLKSILELDPLPGKSPDQILAAISERVISKPDYYLHEHIVSVIDELISENEGYLDLDYKERKDLAYEKAKEKLSEMETPLIQTPDLDVA